MPRKMIIPCAVTGAIHTSLMSLYTLVHCGDGGVIKAPFLVQSVIGIPGRIGSQSVHVVHIKRPADRCFGDQYRSSSLATSRH